MIKPLTCAIALACALGGCEQNNALLLPPETNRYDVFFLESSRVYTYRFTAASDARSVTSYSGSADSGIVSFTIRGPSQVSDTTIQWTVEMRQVLRRIVSYQSWDGSGRDTLWIDTTTVGSLLESTVGRHELTASIDFWTFPIWTGPETVTSRVYRYADSSHVTIIRLAGEFSNIHMRDTLAFASGYGFVARRYGYWNVGNSGWGYGMSADLIEPGK
jgi:hypothetical protein